MLTGLILFHAVSTPILLDGDLKGTAFSAQIHSMSISIPGFIFDGYSQGLWRKLGRLENDRKLVLEESTEDRQLGLPFIGLQAEGLGLSPNKNPDH